MPRGQGSKFDQWFAARTNPPLVGDVLETERTVPEDGLQHRPADRRDDEVQPAGTRSRHGRQYRRICADRPLI